MAKYRINPNTNQKFKRGDYDESGEKRFFAYRGHIKKDGFHAEVWFANLRYEEHLDKTANKQRRETKLNKKSNFPRRINEATGEEFKPGERNEAGLYFLKYHRSIKRSGGYCGEIWATKEAWVRARIGTTIYKIKKRASKKNIIFDVDIDYLYSIFPIDCMRCPILDIEMDFAGERRTSPSVDRLIPELGYIRGNVTWVSLLANVVKKDRTPIELRLIADWIEKQPVYLENYSKEP